MDQWNEGGGGGYFENGMGTPSTESKSKPAARQQFLCPVTIRQLLEAPEEGLKVGNFTATMVTLVGIVTDVNNTSTNIKFTISDDTGVIECLDWIESEDSGEVAKRENLMECNYYQVFGCIKSPQGLRRIMVFKVVPIDDFNYYTAFMAEVLRVNRYAQKMNLGGGAAMEASAAPTHSQLPFSNNFADAKPKLNPQQKEVLDAITAVESQIGWNKADPNLRRKYSPQQMDSILDYLIGEGYIYSTIDDEHYSHT